ncbi:MAG: PatB family C-S lyase [Bacteroidetes bacterium]|nr:PatB family C-S lyase [Bacteroidota bacterium]
MIDFDKVVDRENTSCVKYDLRQKIFDRPDVIPMWVADMDFPTPDFIRKAVLQRAENPIYGYSFRPESYVDSIQKWLLRRHGWSTESDWFVFSPGIVPAVNFAILSLTNPGDGVIIQPPVYFPFFNAVNDHGRKLLTNQLVLKNNQYQIDFDDFERKAKQARLFILSSPHNPVGRVWQPDELQKLGEICVRNNVIILSDEIHNDLILPGNRHTVMASVSSEIARITLTCIAPSKTFNIAGLATSSVIISNPDLRKKYASFIDSIHLTGGNIFGSVASIAGYTHGDSWVDALMVYIEENLSILSHALDNSIIKVIKPEATYMAWLDFRATQLSDEEIKRKLIFEAGLGLSHGSTFGEGGEGFQRINLATPANVVVEATKRLAEIF